jgi:hypothetical protein
MRPFAARLTRSLLVIVPLVAFCVPTAAWAEASANAARDVLLPWTSGGGFSDNWAQGAGFAALGIIGALVLVYLFLGEFLPSMGGKAAADELRIEIQQLVERRDAQLRLRESYASGDTNVPEERLNQAVKLVADLTEVISSKEGQMTQRRRSAQRLGLPIYLLLGGAFAVLFAANALQAILVGFGWTAIADRVGLKREIDRRSQARGQEAEQLLVRARGKQEADQEVARLQAELKMAQNAVQLLAKRVSPE